MTVWSVKKPVHKLKTVWLVRISRSKLAADKIEESVMIRILLSVVVVAAALGSMAIVRGQEQIPDEFGFDPQLTPSVPNQLPVRPNVDLFEDFLPSGPSSAKSDKPSQTQQIVTVQVEVPNDRGQRQKARELQAKYLSLFTGPELEELIQRLEKQIVEREQELATRTDDFGKQLDEIRTQLEALRNDASAVGARLQLETMIRAAENAKNAPGAPTASEPTPATKSAPSLFPSF